MIEVHTRILIQLGEFKEGIDVNRYYCRSIIVEYECECEECGEDFECVVHYANADVTYV